MFFSISCSKCSFSNPLLSIRMKIAVSATMLNHRDLKLFQKFGLEFIKTIGCGNTFINRISQIFFLCKEHGGCWFETIFDDFLIDLIHFLLAMFLDHILFLSDFSLSRCKKIYLVKSFLLAPIHDGFLKSVHEFISGTMLVAGGFLMWFIHIRLPFYCSLSHTVYDDVGMDISGFIMTIGVSNYQGLISGKHLLCKFQTDCLCSLTGKSIFCNIGWIVADNVVVTFDIFTFLILVKMSICQFTFLVKRHRITVQPIHIKLFSQDASTGFIYNLFPGFFIMFKQKVIDSSRVICISAFNVFYDCHSYHLPVSVPLFSRGISP